MLFRSAYYSGAADKAIWRNELIRLLGAVDNNSANPVLALGVATWALSLTGPMDNTPAWAGDASWAGYPGGVANRLSKLPPLLASYIATTEAIDGHFYFKYLPGIGDGGYTETNAYGIMGLAATKNYRTDIDIVWSHVLNAIDSNGDVWYDAFAGPGGMYNATYYLYAGGLLQALNAAVLPGDINRDDKVNTDDLSILAEDWLQLQACTACSLADLTRDRKVNLADFARLAEGWMLLR